MGTDNREERSMARTPSPTCLTRWTAVQVARTEPLIASCWALRAGSRHCRPSPSAR